MSCGSNTDSGSWYYAASRQRYGCGSKIKIEANGKCVVAQTDDYGPDVCVETAAGQPIMDVSPLVAQDLFGMSGLGWSDAKTVTVTQVDGGTALGACTGSSGDPSQDGSGTGTGGASGDPACYCDAACSGYGDCCSNCSGSGSGGAGGSGGSASGGSGGSSGGAACYCDAECGYYGDCCTDCGGGSGGSASGGASGSGGSGGGAACYCDADCGYYGDCCTDCP